MEMKILILWFLTLFFWGSAPLFEKLALKATDPLWALTIRSTFACLILIMASFFTGKAKQGLSLDIKVWLALWASGLFAGVLGMFTYFSLLKAGEASKIVPLTAAYPLVTAILSFLLLGEKLSWLRVLGILMTICGLIILQKS